MRRIKIADNQSPRPQDRIFFSFNYFADVNRDINERFAAPIRNLQGYREIFGLEKTFNQGQASFGLRLPLDTLSAGSALPGRIANRVGTSTALGDLNLFAKFIVVQNPQTGSLISAGMAVTPPTGPSTFAGANYLQPLHSTTIQPFLGYIYSWDRFYLHGFNAVDVPINRADVTMLYNDVGIGYFWLQNSDPSGFLTAVVPTFEVHVNAPLNHANVFNSRDSAGTATVVDLTEGINLEFFRRFVLTCGIVTPVTSPRPFSIEAVVLLNFRF